MKNLIILILFAFLLIPAKGQGIFSAGSIKRDTLFKTSVSKDTTVYRSFKRSMGYFELDVTTLATGDSICVGYATDGQALVPCDSRFPMAFSKSGPYRSIVNGVLKNRIGVTGDWNAELLGIRIKYAGTPGQVKPSLIWNR